MILRGGGGLALLVGTDYLFSSRAWPENLFPGKPRTEYFQPQQIFEKAKKKKKKKKKKRKKRGGGGLCEGLVDGTGHGFLCFALRFADLWHVI